MNIQLKPTSFDFGLTSLEHIFIDEFMPYCSLAQLQVYILGLRFAQEKKDANLSSLANFLNLDYIEVVKAYRYWHEQGLVKLVNEDEETFDVVYLSLRDIYLRSNYEAKTRATSLDYSLWHQELFNEISSILALPLSEMECQSLGEFLHGKELNKELVLMAYDEAKKKKYRNREAIKLMTYWTQHGLTTPEEVESFKERVNFRNYQYREILKALGDPYRLPNIGEKEVIDIWLDEYKFELEEIVREISRVTRSKSNPNMNYLQSVFKRLHDEAGGKETSQSEDEESLRKLGRKL